MSREVGCYFGGYKEADFRDVLCIIRGRRDDNARVVAGDDLAGVYHNVSCDCEYLLTEVSAVLWEAATTAYYC